MTSKPNRFSQKNHNFLDKVPLSEKRFQDLLSNASAFFAEAERDLVAEKASAIKNIQTQMIKYGITVQDLVD